MKVLRLDLRAFGPFTEVALDIADGREGLHMVFGPNEAGKSSALRALRQMLFGIEERTIDRFVHDYERLRVGGTLRAPDGSELAFLRRKGRKRVLRDADDSADLDDAALDRFLAGADLRQYQTLFSLDHETLIAGGRAIVEGEGDVGELVFGAGTDLRELRRLQKQLKTQYESLFRLRGEIYPINQALSALEQARRDVEGASIRSADWHEHRSLLEDARRDRERLDEELADLRRQHSLHERIRQALPDIARLRELRDILDELADAPRLRREFADERRAAEEALRDATRRGESAAEDLAAVARELERLPEPGPILTEAAAIEDLRRRLDIQRNATPEVERLRVERDGHEAIVRDALRDLGLPDDRSEAGRFRVPLARRERIEQLRVEHLSITHDCKGLHKTIESYHTELNHVEAFLDSLEHARDVGPLRRALRRVQRDGDQTLALGEARAALARLVRKAESSAKSLAPWAGPIGAIDALPVPSSEALERFRDELDAESRNVEEARRKEEESREALGDLAAEIETRRQGRDVPTEEDLRAARARRDFAWRLIKAQWRGAGEGAEPEALRAFAGYGGGDLAANFERSLAESDAAADLLRHEADRVNALARLEIEKRRAEEREEAERQSLAAALARESDLLKRWRLLWEPLGFEPSSPREMQAWLRHYAKVVDLLDQVRAGEAEVERLAGRVGAGLDELSNLLVGLGEPRAGANESLPQLIERGQDVIDRIEATEARRAAFQADRVRVELSLATARAEETETLRRLEQWQVAWASAMKSVGLDPDARPEEAKVLLDRTARLAEASAAAESARGRIESHEAEAARLESDVGAVARRAAPDLPTDPFDRAIELLDSRLAEARDARARRGALLTQQERHAETIQAARTEADAARDRLDALVREAGLKSIEDLPAAEARGAALRRTEDERREVENRLRHLSGGLTLEAFLADAESADADALAGEVERIDEQVAALSARRNEVGEAIGREQITLDRMEETARDAKAHEAAGRLQGLLSEIESRAGEYVRVRLASAVLREAIERYRERSQGPVLRLAAGIFARLTCGSFAELRTELDDDGHPHLVGVRPGGEVVGVQGMSEGTCDALYLALKLASLEHHLDHHEAMPLVLDDILVNLDDDRAREALRVLAEFSRRTQVLFFTHHRHLVELAESCLPPDVLFTHELRGAAVLMP